MSPYEVLGLKENADFNEVRTQYYILAKKHHPDKLSANLSETEKKEHEEEFKKISEAYRKINNIKNGEETIEGGNWRDVWNGVESFFNNPDTWECMKILLEKAIKKQEMNKIQKQHNIKVPITLEDIHLSKKKKLRLFLKGIAEPIFLTINTGGYVKRQTLSISYNIEAIEIDINIKLIIDEKKTKYKVLNLVERWDLFYNVYLSWYEYVKGKNIEIMYIDNTIIKVDIPEFYNIELPFIIKNKGLQNKGDLFIVIYIKNPKKEDYDIVKNSVNRESFENLLNAL